MCADGEEKVQRLVENLGNLSGLDGDLRAALLQICRLVEVAGGRVWLVGGGVRDLALGRSVVDLDLEVFGLEAAQLPAVLAPAFALAGVGQSFGVFKVRDWPIDLGYPRRETKTGLGHRGFDVASDPHLALPAAAARRDFTINAVYLDPLTGEVADPWDGLVDLARGVLRHTSGAFVEDPLRVLRAMQFVARFAVQAAPETVALCRTMTPEGLPPERIWAEWEKLLLLGERPSLGLAFLADTGWLQYTPALAALRGCQQDPVHHPEGDVWSHVGHCLDAFARERIGDDWEDLVVGCAVLCHDLGKPATTTVGADGQVRALGHDAASVSLTRDLLVSWVVPQRMLAAVLPLVAEHMRPQQLHQAGASAAAVRRLADRVGRIDRLVRVARADNFGRPPLAADTYPAGDWLLEMAATLAVLKAPPPPLVLGRHLVALGAIPGPHFGDVLQQVYRAQLAGDVGTEAEGVALASRLLSAKPGGVDQVESGPPRPKNG